MVVQVPKHQQVPENIVAWYVSVPLSTIHGAIDPRQGSPTRLAGNRESRESYARMVRRRLAASVYRPLWRPSPLFLLIRAGAGAWSPGGLFRVAPAPAPVNRRGMVQSHPVPCLGTTAHLGSQSIRGVGRA
jgi:hypothetical protein